MNEHLKPEVIEPETWDALAGPDESPDEAPPKPLTRWEKGRARGQEKTIMRGKMNRDAVARMMVLGKNITETARELGLSVPGVKNMWQRAIQEYGSGTLSDDDRARLLALVRGSAEQVLKDSLPLIADSPSHGALVLKAGEVLLNLHKQDPNVNGGGQGATEEEIANRVKIISPLIAGRLKQAGKIALKQVESEVGGSEPQGRPVQDSVQGPA